MKAILEPPTGTRALVSDLTDMTRNPRPVTEDDGSGIGLVLPDDAYFQYAWQTADGRLVPDPDAPETNRNVWYGNVSVIRGPEQRDDGLALRAARVKPRGTLKRHRLESAALGQVRRVNTYTPAGYTSTAELPLILVQDGTAFQRIGLLPNILEETLAEGGRPARLVFLEPADRDSEYSFSAAYHRFVFEELIPDLTELAGPYDELFLLGASLGGLVSTTLALERPQLFAGVATLSGAFLGSPADPDPYVSEGEWLLGRITAGAELPERWFVGTGTLEWLHRPNERVADALRDRGVTSTYLELSAGHNWVNWRNMLARALAALLG
ncbi:MAG TPA: alpha/beta hydrolase-fold protein [Deinococcales bacterium]|nr:alpha/beta hydrolase-fold protein [Deinococcales bacterium]